jgi:type VI secretion system protein ImpB
LSGLSGQLPADKTAPRLRDRQFVEIDRDSFREIFAKIGPRLSFKVDNLMRAPADGAVETPKLEVELGADASPKLDRSKPLDALLVKLLGEDPLYMFHPLWVIRHTPELKTLFEARTRLTDLLGKLDSNDKLAEELKAAVNSPDKPADMVLEASSYPQPKEAGPETKPDTKQLKNPGK